MARSRQYCYDVGVPRKTEWTRLIPQALEELRASDAPLIDRATLQQMLDISPRHALRILSGFLQSYPAGKSLVIGRSDLIAALESVQAGDEVQREDRRRERLTEKLAATRREIAARRVRIDTSPDVYHRRFPDLPAGIHLRPGELRIEFRGAADLLRNLLELSQAIMNDYARFEELTETRG